MGFLIIFLLNRFLGLKEEKGEGEEIDVFKLLLIVFNKCLRCFDIENLGGRKYFKFILEVKVFCNEVAL